MCENRKQPPSWVVQMMEIRYAIFRHYILLG